MVGWYCTIDGRSIYPAIEIPRTSQLLTVQVPTGKQRSRQRNSQHCPPPARSASRTPSGEVVAIPTTEEIIFESAFCIDGKFSKVLTIKLYASTLENY